MTISAKIIADSVSPAGIRITTMQLRYPKFIHSEFMTHRVFSRNASSSRAIPVERLIKDVIDDPVYPMHWGKNQPGMQADKECDEWVKITDKFCLTPSYTIHPRIDAWDVARANAISVAQGFSDAGYHKQIVNRLLEPFCHINVVVTATEWLNFFALRCHPAAQPEMRALATVMESVMKESEPVRLIQGMWHLPYVTTEELNTNDFSDDPTSFHIKLSVARCARVSYLTQDGKTPNVADDLALYERLVGATPLHASPAEHQATPDRNLDNEFATAGPNWESLHLHGNFRGWIQYRKTLPGETQ